MVKAKEEKPPGVPAYMATFADLMTLLLVFFILLNVYAKEKQYGLLAAASGSFKQAIMTTLGQGGVLSGSREFMEMAAAKHLNHATDPDEGPQSKTERRGDELEVGGSKVEELGAVESVVVDAPFTFSHGSSKIPKEGASWLDQLARDLSNGNFVVVVEARAAFLETLTPMELACERGSVLLRWMRDIGVRAELEIRAKVLRVQERGTDGPKHRGVAIRIIRKS